MSVNLFPPLVIDATPYAPSWLLSFHLYKAIVFCVVTLGVGYPLYRLIAVHYLKWEGHQKSPSRHYNDIVSGIGYNIALFAAGNYSNTLNWIMLVSFIPSLFLFGWLTEAPFLRHSFATIKNWSFGMHATVYIAVVVIFGVLGYLIRLAYVTRVDPDGLQSILGWYLVLLAIPVILLFSGIFSAWVQNRDGLLKRTVSSSSTDALQDACQTTPKWKRVSLHPHHWAIFYVLAFLTRFDDPVSNVAAGLVIGIYMQGIAAYGYDHLLE